MELLQLKYFVHAAQCENFSHTANFYMIPQSSVSQTVKKLERELNTTLFERKGNKVLLNENGKTFLKYAKKALSLLDEGCHAVLDNNEISGEIKILARTSRRILTEFISDFKNKYPKVTFVLTHDFQNRNFHDFDVIISEESKEFKDFQKNILFSEPFLWAISKKNPLSKKSRIFFSDIKNERLIAMKQGSSMRKEMNKIFEIKGHTPNVVVESDDPYYLRKYVAMDLGISFIPSVSWRNQFDEDVVLIKSEDIHVVRNTCLYFPKDKYISNAVKAFLEEITDFFAITRN